jgi:hypothetical protein
MLHSARALSRYEAHATDGKLGRAVDAYFDNVTREIRYLVVETSRWLPGKKLLISNRWLGLPDKDSKRFPINMTRAAAEERTASTNELPVSWKMEELLKVRFGGLDSRGGPPVGTVLGSVIRQGASQVEVETAAVQSADNPDLRSLREIMGYQIEAMDGPLGVAYDFLIDDDGWVVRWLVVDTKSWKPGREVLVPPEWIETVSWSEHRIHVRVSRQKVKTSQRVDRASHSGG